MLILISPTKEWNTTQELPSPYEENPGKPPFQDEADRLIGLLASFDPASLEKLMKISPALAGETCRRIGSIKDGTAIKKPALLSYGGTQYKHIEPETLEKPSLDYAEKHLRILSGLYGILRPLDVISPYRLEMKTPLAIPGEGRLNAFWKTRLAAKLTEDKALADSRAPIINLASQEYSSAIDFKKLANPKITLFFKDKTAAGLRTVGMYAKEARGKMVRMILETRPDDVASLQELTAGGYRYSSQESDGNHWVYVRKGSRLTS